MSYGAQTKFAIARQTAAGSGSAATDPGSFHHFPFINEDIGLEKDEVISQNLTGRFEQGATYGGINRITGVIEYEPTPKAVGMALTAVMKQPTSVSSADLRTYTFFPRTQDFSSTIINEPCTVYKQWSDASSAECYFDVQFGQLEFTFTQGQLLRSRMTCAGGSRMFNGVGSMGIVLDSTDLGMNWRWDVASVSYGGAAVANYSEVTVSINENLDALYTLNGTLSPYKFTRTTFREVTVQGTMYFADRNVLNDFASDAQRRLIITARNTLTAIQSGYYPTLEIDVPQLKITQFKPGNTGPGEVAVSFTGRGVIDSSSNYVLKVTLINTYGAGY